MAHHVGAALACRPAASRPGPGGSGAAPPAGRPGIQRAAHLVELAHPLRVQRRDLQAAAGASCRKPSRLSSRRPAARLARHREPLRDVFLRDPLPGASEPSLMASPSER
jgi:hypothetical protein